MRTDVGDHTFLISNDRRTPPPRRARAHVAAADLARDSAHCSPRSAPTWTAPPSPRRRHRLRRGVRTGVMSLLCPISAGRSGGAGCVSCASCAGGRRTSARTTLCARPSAFARGRRRQCRVWCGRRRRRVRRSRLAGRAQRLCGRRRRLSGRCGRRCGRCSRLGRRTLCNQWRTDRSWTKCTDTGTSHRPLATHLPLGGAWRAVLHASRQLGGALPARFIARHAPLPRVGPLLTRPTIPVAFPPLGGMLDAPHTIPLALLPLGGALPAGISALLRRLRLGRVPRPRSTPFPTICPLVGARPVRRTRRCFTKRRRGTGGPRPGCQTRFTVKRQRGRTGRRRSGHSRSGSQEIGGRWSSSSGR